MNTHFSGQGSIQAVATDNSGRCSFPSCGKLLRGRVDQRYCSDAHRFQDWDRLHPRQPVLNFESQIAPRPLPEDPEARRDAGKAIAASNNRWQLAKAQELALEYLSTHPVAIISDIRALAAERGIELEWWKPWTANVFLPGKETPWFEPTGVRRKTYHRGGNARKVNEYRLTTAGRKAFERII